MRRCVAKIMSLVIRIETKCLPQGYAKNKSKSDYLKCVGNILKKFRDDSHDFDFLIKDMKKCKLDKKKFFKVQ